MFGCGWDGINEKQDVTGRGHGGSTRGPSGFLEKSQVGRRLGQRSEKMVRSDISYPLISNINTFIY